MARRPNFAEVVSKSNVGYGILRSRGAAEGHASRGIHAFELVLLLLLVFVVLFAALARKLLTPYPIVLVIGGLFLSFIPGIPKITLNPDVIFLVVLPPLLYNGAWLKPWREFKFNFVSIFLLASGLAGFTLLEWRERFRMPFILRRKRFIPRECRRL